MDSAVVLSDYNAMDRAVREERSFILKTVQKIRTVGCNVVLLQKSILRDAVTELGEHYLAMANIFIVKDLERDDIDFIRKTLDCVPVPHIDYLANASLARANVVEEIEIGVDKVVKVSGIKSSQTATVLLRGSNMLVL